MNAGLHIESVNNEPNTIYFSRVEKQKRRQKASFFNWWSWRELNPRPESVNRWYYMLSLSFI